PPKESRKKTIVLVVNWTNTARPRRVLPCTWTCQPTQQAIGPAEGVVRSTFLGQIGAEAALKVLTCSTLERTQCSACCALFLTTAPISEALVARHLCVGARR